MSWERLLHSMQLRRMSSREHFGHHTPSDSFEQEALEGWQSIGSKEREEALKRLDKKFKTKSPKGYLLAAAFTALIAFILFWPAEKKANDSTETYVEITDLVKENDFEQNTPLIQEQKKEIIALQKKQEASPVKMKPLKEEGETTKENTDFIIDPLPTKGIEKIDNKSGALSTRKKAKEINISNFTLVDYRTLRGKPTIPSQQVELTGTAANLEGEESEEPETSIRTVDIPYIDYIEKTMDFLDHGSMKKTLNRLENILMVYPDDVNALFYAGFVCFQTEQYEQSVWYLNQLKSSLLTNFDQERDWYLAKNYLKLKQFQKAKSLFNEIANGNSFYAKQAQIELNENPLLK